MPGSTRLDSFMFDPFLLQNNLKQSKVSVRFGFKGVSDVVGINGEDGKFIAIECKVGKNKPTQFQISYLPKSYIIRNIIYILENPTKLNAFLKTTGYQLGSLFFSKHS